MPTWCGLVVAVPEGRRTRYELADARLRHALTDLLGVVLAVDPTHCAQAGENGLLLMVTELRPDPSAVDRRRVLSRRIRLLVFATIAYNVIEAVVAITAGTVASSSALVGFGLDSVIEVASAIAVAWQFAGPDHEARERTALRVIAVSFFALAVYVGVDAVRSLFDGDNAQHSAVGLVLAGLSLLIMPGLSYAERRAGRELGSRSAVADSKQTLLCTYLSRGAVGRPGIELLVRVVMGGPDRGDGHRGGRGQGRARGVAG